MKLYCLENDCYKNEEGICQMEELQIRYDNTIPAFVIETEDYGQCYQQKPRCEE